MADAPVLDVAPGGAGKDDGTALVAGICAFACSAAGWPKVPVSLARVFERFFEYAILCHTVSAPFQGHARRKIALPATYHLPAEELVSLTASQRLRRTVLIAEQHVRLAAHRLCLERCDVQHGAVGREEHVERAPQVFLLQLLGQILEVERLIRGCGRGELGGGGGRYRGRHAGGDCS